MPAEPKISVLVPVYMVEQYIERCVRSLFEQTMTEGVEFIFVNDHSRDRSIELLSACIDRYPNLRHQITIINHHQNRGLAAARLTALKAARGEYIINLDSDDFFELDMLERMYHAAVTTKADVVVADFFWSLKKGEVYHRCRYYSNKEAILKRIIAPWKYENYSVGPNLWNKLIKRTIYLDNNITPVEGINQSEDFIVTMQALYHAKIITKVDRAFVHYNQQNSASFSQNKTAATSRQRLMATETVARFFAQKGCPYTEEFNQRRFREKMIAVTNCDLADIEEFLSLYQHLDYREYKHLVQPYWRIPYKLALQGNRTLFVLLRNLLLTIRKVYRSYAR